MREAAELSQGKIVILGSSGQLGSSIVREARNREIEFLSLSRATRETLRQDLNDPAGLIRDLALSEQDLVINALGVVKQKIDDKSISDVQEAMFINGEMPSMLGSAVSSASSQLIQVGSDCVFSGNGGPYGEKDTHDAEEVYGISKSKGESSFNVRILRSSFVGPSNKGNPGLWNWVQHQPRNAVIDGYVDHLWNGTTTNAIAKILVGGFEKQIKFPRVQHLVPEDFVTKAELLRMIANRLGRSDLEIREIETQSPRDMRLKTVDEELNRTLWRLGGFGSTPTIHELISSLPLE